MKTIRTANLTKIPGALPTINKEHYIEVFSKYSTIQLEELRDRQEKLLNNKMCLSKLRDKGKRIQDFHEKIVKELLTRNEIDRAAELFSELNIASKGIATITNMEWNGKLSQDEQTILDSDDDEDVDTIKILAQSRNKNIKIIKPENTLITPSDLEEIKSFNEISSNINEKLDSNCDLDPHAIYVCGKDNHDNMQQKFLPFKTTKTNVHSIEKEKARKIGKHWEITAATPPQIRNCETIRLSLEESIAIQRVQIESLKKIEEKRANERLAARSHLTPKILSTPRTVGSFEIYRDTNYSSQSEDEKELNSENED